MADPGRKKRKKKGPPTEYCKWKNIDGVRTRVCRPVKTGKTKEQVLRDRWKSNKGTRKKI